MKKLKVLFLLMLCVLLACGGALADVTITDEEYALLLKYQKLETIKWIVDQYYLWDADEEAMDDGAAQGLLTGLGDQYTYYYNAEAFDSAEEEFEGEYAGLGFEVFANYTDYTITVRRVFHNSPAWNAGILPNDKIIAVDDVQYTAYELSDAVSVMRGTPGEEVKLTIYRDGDSFEAVCTRATVENETLSYYMMDNNIGYIRIYYFEGNLDTQFAAAIAELAEQGMEALVLDLRGNPGGYTNLAEDVADTFLVEDEIIYSAEDKYGRILTTYAENDGIEVPIAVLINGSTASASEILTCALEENGRAFTVGTKSFGKGIMQRVIQLDETTGMQLTSEYWLTPEGNCIHEEGITPDYEVELAEDALNETYDYEPSRDNQLAVAVEQLLEQMNTMEQAQ